MLILILITNIIGLFALLLACSRFTWLARSLSVVISCLLFFISVVMWVLFENHNLQFQFLVFLPWFSNFNIHILLGVDGLSLFFILVTTLIFPFAILASGSLNKSKFLLVNLLFIEFCLILTFSVLDLFLFCLFFESLLIPMFFIILHWGTRERRSKALSYFYLYTLLGSIFIMLAIFLLYFETQSTSFFVLLNNTLSDVKQAIIWLLLFAVFAIKIPMFPFHIWLPEAHVEAPTVGSVILAALLLKLGSYGMLRFLFIFDYARYCFQPWIIIICIISIIFSSTMAIRQLDLKRIIAYSSIAHMNFGLLGYFSNNIYGLTGGLLLMISHGIVSAAIFFIVGVAYERHHTRFLYYYGGLVQLMPIYAIFCFLFIISNFSFPGTSNFIGELLILISLGLGAQKFILFIAGLSTFFTLVYSILLFNRMMFGNIKTQFIELYTDIKRYDSYILTYLMFANLLMGLIPNSVIGAIYIAIANIARYVMSYRLMVVHAPQDTLYTSEPDKPRLKQPEAQFFSWLQDSLDSAAMLRLQYQQWLFQFKKLPVPLDFNTWQSFCVWLLSMDWMQYQRWIKINGSALFILWCDYQNWLKNKANPDMEFAVWLEFMQWKKDCQLLQYNEWIKEHPATSYAAWEDYQSWLEQHPHLVEYMTFDVWQEFSLWVQRSQLLQYNEWLKDHPLNIGEEKLRHEAWLESNPHLAEHMTFEVWQEFVEYVYYLNWVDYQQWLEDNTNPYMDFDVWLEFIAWKKTSSWEGFGLWLKDHPLLNIKEEKLRHEAWLESNPHLAEHMTFEVWQEFVEYLYYAKWLESNPHLEEYMTVEVWKEFVEYLDYVDWLDYHKWLDTKPSIVLNFDMWREFMEWQDNQNMQGYDVWLTTHADPQFDQWISYMEYLEQNPHLAEYMTFDVWQEFGLWIHNCQLLQYNEWKKEHPETRYSDWLEYQNWLDTKPYLVELMPFDVWQEFVQWLYFCNWNEYQNWLKDNTNPYMDFNVWVEFMHWRYDCQLVQYFDWIKDHPDTPYTDWLDYQTWLENNLNTPLQFDVWQEFIQWKDNKSWEQFNEYTREHLLDAPASLDTNMQFQFWLEFLRWKDNESWKDFGLWLKDHPLNMQEEKLRYETWLQPNPHLAEHMTFEVWQEFTQWLYFCEWLKYQKWLESNSHLEEYMTFDVWQEFVPWKAEQQEATYADWKREHPLLNIQEEKLRHEAWLESNPHLAEHMTFEVWQEFVEYLYYAKWLESNPHLEQYMTFEVWKEFVEYLDYVNWLDYQTWLDTKPSLVGLMPFDVWQEFMQWSNFCDWKEYQKWLENEMNPHMDFNVWRGFMEWKYNCQLAQYYEWIKEHPDTLYKDWLEYQNWLENNLNTQLPFDVWQEFIQWKNNDSWDQFQAWIEAHPDFLLTI